MHSVPTDYYSNPRPEMVELIPAAAKTLLDVGCGSGDFASLAKEKRNVIAWGVDIDRQSIEIANNRLDKAICGDMAQVIHALPENYFDVVFFNDSIEHMVDPYSVLDAIKSKLTPDGIVVSSIPNVRYFRNLLKLLYQKDWEYEDSGILDRTHLRFFTRKSIIAMFEKGGYEVVSIEGLSKTRSIRPFIFNMLTFGGFTEDTKYLQFVTIAKPRV